MRLRIRQAFSTSNVTGALGVSSPASRPILPANLFGPSALKCSGWDLPFTSLCGDSEGVLFPNVPLVHLGRTGLGPSFLGWVSLDGSQGLLTGIKSLCGWFSPDFPADRLTLEGKQPVGGLACGLLSSSVLIIKHLVGNLDQVRGRKLMSSVRGTLGNEIRQDCLPF